MSKFVYFLATVLAMSLVVMIFVGSTSAIEYVLQPSPGYNDGTDDGSADAGKDVMIKQGQPNTNFGDGDQWKSIYTGEQASFGDNRSFVQFSPDNLPEDIISATLRLRSYYGPGHNSNGVLEAFNVLEDWNEITVTWNTQPDYDPVAIASAAFQNEDGWVELDVTTLYRQWKSGAPNCGIMLDTMSQSGYEPGHFYASDYGIPEHRPMLVVEAVTPIEMLQELINTVISLNLQHGIENSLADAKLENVLKALSDANENNDGAAINKLDAFISDVEAQRGKEIADEDAQTLIDAASAIIDKLLAE